MSYLKFQDFFEISQLYHKEIFTHDNVFMYLGNHLKDWITKFLLELGVKDKPIILGKVEENTYIRGPVYIDKDTLVESTALIQGPCYIGPNAQVRHGAYIRGNVYIGSKAVVGHTTEVKGAIFLDGAKAGHFAYIGDSILGKNVNLGAGTKLANLKFKHDEVCFLDPYTNQKKSSGLKKFGAIIGDNAQTGCNVVLDPGTLLLPHTGVLPGKYFKGTLKIGIAK